MEAGTSTQKSPQVEGSPRYPWRGSPGCRKYLADKNNVASDKRADKGARSWKTPQAPIATLGTQGTCTHCRHLPQGQAAASHIHQISVAARDSYPSHSEPDLEIPPPIPARQNQKSPFQGSQAPVDTTPPKMSIFHEASFLNLCVKSHVFLSTIHTHCIEIPLCKLGHVFDRITPFIAGRLLTDQFDMTLRVRASLRYPGARLSNGGYTSQVAKLTYLRYESSVVRYRYRIHLFVQCHISWAHSRVLPSYTLQRLGDLR